MTTERRLRRSPKAHEAVCYFLESFREKAGLDAVALTTSDGLLIGGAGQEVDLEWMGALGAASNKPSLKWESRTLHVEPLAVHQFELFLTSSGRKVKAQALTEGLERILPLA